MRNYLWRHRGWWLAPLIVLAVLIGLVVVLGEGGDLQRVYPRF